MDKMNMILETAQLMMKVAEDLRSLSDSVQAVCKVVMQKLMGKTEFEEILGDLIYKPPGKLTLAPNTDKRPAVNVSNVKNEFNEILED